MLLLQVPKMLEAEWKAWEPPGKENRAGTLVEGKYTRSSDLYSVGLMLLKYRPVEWWQPQDTARGDFLSHLLGHEKTVEELMGHPWLDRACQKLPGTYSIL